jgi:hypothetical protein
MQLCISTDLHDSLMLFNGEKSMNVNENNHYLKSFEKTTDILLMQNNL